MAPMALTLVALLYFGLLAVAASALAGRRGEPVGPPRHLPEIRSSIGPARALLQQPWRAGRTQVEIQQDLQEARAKAQQLEAQFASKKAVCEHHDELAQEQQDCQARLIAAGEHMRRPEHEQNEPKRKLEADYAQAQAECEEIAARLKKDLEVETPAECHRILQTMRRRRRNARRLRRG